MITPKNKTESILETLKTIEGLNVYFQVPANIKMIYPCAILNLETINNKSADNTWYRPIYVYKLTVIERSKHSKFMSDVITKLQPYIRHDNFAELDGLYHNYYTINI